MIRFDGETRCESARKVETELLEEENAPAGFRRTAAKYRTYEIEAFRQKDHALIRIKDGTKIVKSIIAFPDSTRFAYLAITGEHCTVSNIHVDQDVEPAEEIIPRIAEWFSYIKDCPEGDIPNVQIDGWRTDATIGIPITKQMEILFHTQSLPMARLIWHCPFITIFSSKDGKVGGEGYREFLLLRLDGENWESDSHVVSKTELSHTGAFVDWNNWKAENLKGMDCRVEILREGNIVSIFTENLGISLKSVTAVKGEVGELYVARTGDEVALTNIRIKNPPG